MAEPALIFPDLPPVAEPQPAERRGAARVPVRFAVRLDRPGHPPVEAEAENLSATGLLVRADRDLPVWSRLTAALPAAGPREVRIVRRDGDRYGCLFACPLEPDELDALLASPEAEAGFEALRAEAQAPPPPPRRGLLRLWKR